MAWNCGVTGPWLTIGNWQWIALRCEMMGGSNRYWGGPRVDFIWLDVLHATGSPNFQPSCDFSEWMTGKCWRKTRYFGSICKGASFNLVGMQCFHNNSWILPNRKTSVFSRPLFASSFTWYDGHTRCYFHFDFADWNALITFWDLMFPFGNYAVPSWHHLEIQIGRWNGTMFFTSGMFGFKTSHLQLRSNRGQELHVNSIRMFCYVARLPEHR